MVRGWLPRKADSCLITLALFFRSPCTPEPLAHSQAAGAVLREMAAKCTMLSAGQGGTVLAGTRPGSLPATCATNAPGECHCECEVKGRPRMERERGTPGFPFVTSHISCLPQKPHEFPSVRGHPNLCVQVRMVTKSIGLRVGPRTNSPPQTKASTGTPWNSCPHHTHHTQTH